MSSETFIYVFSPLLVFEAAITSDYVRWMLEHAAPSAVVATVVYQARSASRYGRSRAGRCGPRCRRRISCHRGVPRCLGRAGPAHAVAGEALLKPCGGDCHVRSAARHSSPDANPTSGTALWHSRSRAGRRWGRRPGVRPCSSSPTRDDGSPKPNTTVALAYLVFISAERRTSPRGRLLGQRLRRRASRLTIGRSSLISGLRSPSGRIRWSSCSPRFSCRSCCSTRNSTTSRAGRGADLGAGAFAARLLVRSCSCRC